jgi:hypothetical protein
MPQSASCLTRRAALGALAATVPAASVGAVSAFAGAGRVRPELLVLAAQYRASLENREGVAACADAMEKRAEALYPKFPEWRQPGADQALPAELERLADDYQAKVVIPRWERDERERAAWTAIVSRIESELGLDELKARADQAWDDERDAAWALLDKRAATWEEVRLKLDLFGADRGMNSWLLVDSLCRDFGIPVEEWEPT